MEQKSDNELMQLLAGQNTMALRILYRRYEIAIFNFLLRNTGSREIAQELIQETFSRIWFSARTFQPDRGHFKGWIYTIALNLARDEMSKKQYTFQYVDLDDMCNYKQIESETHSESPDVIMENMENRRALSRALGQLKPHHREVILMKNYQHLTFQEIAQVMAVPESTIKARYNQAVVSIKKHLRHKEVKQDGQSMQIQ